MQAPPDADVPRTFFRLRKRAERKAARPEEVRSLVAVAVAKYHVVRPHLTALRRDLPTLLRLTRAYGDGSYRRIPWRAIVSIIAAVLYFVMPFDAIPDFIPLIGYLDDAVVVAYVMRLVHDEVEAFRVWEEAA